MRNREMCLYAYILIACSQLCIHAVGLVTNPKRGDGFGAQFQSIVCTAMYAEVHGMKFVYTPFTAMEHNYDNDPDFLDKKEKLINFIDNFDVYRGEPGVKKTDGGSLPEAFESNMVSYLNTDALKKIKRIFRENKNKQEYFDDRHFNIAVHMRRPNKHDIRLDGADTPDNVFVNIINKLRTLYSSKNALFHIYSQGRKEDFTLIKASDVILHLNDSIEDTFSSLVFADVLVASRSSFSYVAGILSEGIVYYIPFWHAPLPDWISVKTVI
jgi:hypothetical protein